MNSPYPYALCTFIPGRTPDARRQRATSEAQVSEILRGVADDRRTAGGAEDACTRATCSIGTANIPNG